MVDTPGPPEWWSPGPGRPDERHQPLGPPHSSLFSPDRNPSGSPGRCRPLSSPSPRHKCISAGRPPLSAVGPGEMLSTSRTPTSGPATSTRSASTRARSPNRSTSRTSRPSRRTGALSGADRSSCASSPRPWPRPGSSRPTGLGALAERAVREGRADEARRLASQAQAALRLAEHERPEVERWRQPSGRERRRADAGRRPQSDGGSGGAGSSPGPKA